MDAAPDVRLISIHALREEGDHTYLTQTGKVVRFLSTPSARRATRLVWSTSKNDRVFLSTPSARRATHRDRLLKVFISISIHALREEGDEFRPIRCNST